MTARRPRALVFLPVLAFAALIGLFAAMLTADRDPKEIKSVLIGRPAPDFQLPALDPGGPGLDGKTLTAPDQPVLVNFFASWCVPCRAEHSALMNLAQKENVRLVGIAYKDDPADARAFLDELGNPFSRIGVDRDGRVAIDWGVTGVPETFLVGPDGVVRYRHFGPIIGDSLQKRLLPELEKVR
ncbi:DsbE family thiol:disulfide interchange protein [Yunchengibacter salinarum]|uniref:DsbE family thiol:disulfide interchange protein n=1 Tax=Yunchengibacter salinarum TaxID=3133399 RepID=UPI0035B5F535